MPEPTFDDAYAVLKKNGLAREPLVRCGHEGVVNAVFLGERFVVRICKDTNYLSDIYTETVAVPPVAAAGIATPALIAFDDSRDTIPAVYTVYERADGVPAPSVSLASSFFVDLGHEIARLHTLVRDVPDPRGYLDRPDPWPPLMPIEANVAHGLLNETDATHWKSLAASLEPAFAFETKRAFLHGDLHVRNLLATADGRGMTAIVDWGDAGWGDPAIEFGNLSPGGAVTALDAYRGAGAETDDGFEGRILSEILARAQGRLGEGNPALLADLRAFMSSNPPPAWRRWLP